MTTSKYMKTTPQLTLLQTSKSRVQLYRTRSERVAIFVEDPCLRTIFADDAVVSLCSVAGVSAQNENLAALEIEPGVAAATVGEVPVHDETKRSNALRSKRPLSELAEFRP